MKQIKQEEEEEEMNLSANQKSTRFQGKKKNSSRCQIDSHSVAGRGAGGAFWE